jgi:hypothetical protein
MTGAALPVGKRKRAQKVYHALAKSRKRVYAAHARCHATLASLPMRCVQARWSLVSLAMLAGATTAHCRMPACG